MSGASFYSTSLLLRVFYMLAMLLWEDKDSFPSLMRLHGLTLTNRMFFVPLSSPVIMAPKWLNVSLFFLVCISVGPSKRGGLPSSPVLQQQMPVGCRCHVEVTNVESCVDGQHGKCVGSIGTKSLDILKLPIRR